jgi:hypothetical protein
VQRQTARLTGGIRKNIGPVLRLTDFDATLSFLREMHSTARTTGTPNVGDEATSF